MRTLYNEFGGTLKASASQIKDKDKEKLLSAVAEDAHFTKQSSETAQHFKSKIYK